MDLLYSKYSSPMDLVSRYINQGRFGKFVHDFLQIEYDRRKEEAERNNDWMLWVGYVHSESSESFDDWKARVTKPAHSTTGGDANLTEDGIRSIVDKLFTHTE